MNLKDLVKKTITRKPPRIVLHGVHGVGKSTWAAGAPAPVFIQTEDGLVNIEVDHFPVAQSMDEAFSFIGHLINEEHEYKTVVIDTVDWLEKLIWRKVCEDNNVKSIEGIGYGKGYMFAQQHWDRFFNGLDMLRNKGLAVVVLAHNEIKTFNPPDGEAYDRYQIKLHKHAASKLEEWADLVLFANFKVYVDSDTNKVVNSSERVIHTTNRPAWRAKTRYSLPEELPLDFNKLMEALKNG